MPMDDYDYSHNHMFDFELNIYQNDDIDAKISDFFIENKFYEKTDSIQYISDTIKNCITNMRNGLKILDHRYITSISSRVFGYEEEMTVEFYKTRWCLITVWRGMGIVNV